MTRSTHGAGGFDPIPTDAYYGAQIDYEMIDLTEMPPLDGESYIAPGTLPGSAFDPFPPAVPTGLALTSEVVIANDGHSFVRLIIQLVQPADVDLYGCLVEVTAHNDGAPSPAPIWDDPEEVFIPSLLSYGRLENVQGVTQYWARARSEDVQGNFSAYSGVVTHTTIGDTTPPPTPETPVVTAGFRGFTAYWSGGDALDRSHYEIRYAAGASPPVDDSWTYQVALASIIWIGNLLIDPPTLYWLQVRSIDRSGNVSGWSPSASVTPLSVGQADLGLNSVSAALGHIADLNADKILAGTLTLKPSGSSMTALTVVTIDDPPKEVVNLNKDGTMRFYDTANPGHYLLINAGKILFTETGDTGEYAAFTAQGIDAGAIRFGEAQGGHNLLLNSSFELSDFVAADSLAVFTDNTTGGASDPAWHANFRLAAIVNLTEGAADLKVALVAY